MAVASDETSAFATLGLHPAILRALSDLGFNEPTPVQAQAIPAFLAGNDLLVSSQTGSGKTAAFMLPAIQRLAALPESERPQRPEANPRGGRQRFGDRPQPGKGRRPRPAPAKPAVLVLTPTRELALQVTTATAQFGKYLRRIEVASILGGMPYPKQLEMLARMPDILVATPGRLLDHVDSGRIDLSALQMLVFDEADRMLDMGFQEDIDAIIDATPAERQTLMFSATLDMRIAKLAERMLKNPVRIEIAGAKLDQNHIEQRLHFADDLGHKHKLLDHVLRDVALKQAIVFTATKRDADSLADRLAEAGFIAGALHGDMNQGARNRTLTMLRKGTLRVLVATDVAARGIDVPDITHVVNFDLPKQAEDYVHRIGRTGRAGRSGIAINLVNHSETLQWRRIERFIDKRLMASTIDGLEPRRAPKASPGKFAGKPSGKPGGKFSGKPGGRAAAGHTGNHFGARAGGGAGHGNHGGHEHGRGSGAFGAPRETGWGDRPRRDSAPAGNNAGRNFSDRATRNGGNFSDRGPRGGGNRSRFGDR